MHTVVLKPVALVARLHLFSAAIRLEHSVFALPFAYIGMVLAANGLPTWSQIIWITLAMVSARTVAMTANRLVHEKEDGMNPRTAMRHLPSGLLGRREMLCAMLVSIALFVFAASQLNFLAFVLSPVVVAVLFLYSYAKYFTWSSHFILGWADAIAPVGAWVGVTGAIEPEAVLLALGVALWVGGFDIIYACLDYDFDRSFGIHSIPSRFGIRNAIRSARFMHLATSTCLLLLGVWMNLGIFYYIGVGFVSALLLYQHIIVKLDDLSNATRVTMKINSYVGLVLLATTLLAVFL